MRHSDTYLHSKNPQILSVITITSKHGTRDAKVSNAKTRHRVRAVSDQSHLIPGFSSAPDNMVDTPLKLEPSDFLKGYAVITVFRTRGIVIHIAHKYGVTFQVNDIFAYSQTCPNRTLIKPNSCQNRTSSVASIFFLLFYVKKLNKP